MKSFKQLLSLFVLMLVIIGLLPLPGQAQAELVCETDVIVQDGDWLSTIAEQAYGDPTLYRAIAYATNLKVRTDSSYATVDSHDVIEPGWKLCLPDRVTAEELEVIAPVDPGTIAVDQLINATYSGIYDDPVTLTEGRYEGEPFAEGDASRPIVEYISQLYGDLDGDGAEDAVVFLVENSGGTGNFVYAAAQLNQNGAAVDAGAVWIEDRIQVKSAAIENGQVMLEVTAAGPGDAACCKRHKTNKVYALQNGKLAEIAGAGQDLVKISAADLDGTTWTLLELSEDQPALADTEVTLSFAGDQLSGSAGCNNYTGSFSLGADNPFVLTTGPIAATKMACPDPILNQENAYLNALQSAVQWGYEIGKLAIYYPVADGSYARLLFAPPAADNSAMDMLTASTWQWVRLTDPLQQVEIEQPQNHTLTFLADGTIQIQADCNRATATYSAGADGSLSVQPGISTLAACPAGSRGEELVQKLGFAARYFFQDGHLFIDMMADGGTLEFSPQAVTN
jgi:heat shock protein HslJ